MSSPFAFLRSVTAKADKAAQKFANAMETSGQMSYQDAFDQCFDQECRSALRQIRLMKRMKEAIQDEFADLLELPKKEKQSYMITVRPNDTKIDLIDFIQKVNSLTSRKCFLEGSYSFEQKGTCVDDLGKGFHVHIVAKMSQASKGQVLRDVTSTFKDWIDKGFITPNNIDVRTTKNPDELINTYLVEYKSDDGHKEVTQSWDELWRTGNSLKRLYTITQ